MKTKEEIVKLLMDRFNYVYCNTCKFRDDDTSCDGCHRKYMNWELHEDVANAIADEILKE